ncbi:anti-sigma factor family protein [Actinacidiphila rubida]|uniref:Zinc-finger domain-containing protein n=1 Tax=Actinacidiphila rubida TaxID=310780 RepID=A0A1H8GH80_9ACTN|nr:hypothetical protein [Actinacidiphila rubida]SEN43159.1 hypothetical protein SAMN05216267_100587 [Actinacidiphila rubida]
MTTGMDPHPEVSEISDFSEGLVGTDRGRAIRAHLDTCELCRDVLRSLEEIRGLLGTLPGPQRMPADIAGRIDAALAAEALLDATLPHVPRETSAEPSAAPERGMSVPRETGKDVPRETSTSPGGHPGGTTGPGRGGRPGERSPSRRRRGLLAVAGAVGAALLGGVIYTAASGTGSAGSSLDSARQTSAAGSTTAAVGSQVRELLAGPHHSTTKQSPGGNTPMLQPNSTGSVTQPDGATVPVPSCVLKATHRSQPPLAAERELFQGTPSYLVVLPHPNDASRVDAFVLNASCTVSSPGAVLFQGTYPR